MPPQDLSTMSSVFESIGPRESVQISQFSDELASSAGTSIYGSDTFSRQAVSKDHSIDLRSSSRELETSSIYSTCYNEYVVFYYSVPKYQYKSILVFVQTIFPWIDWDILLQSDGLLGEISPTVLPLNCIRRLRRKAHEKTVQDWIGGDFGVPQDTLDYIDLYKHTWVQVVAEEVAKLYKRSHERIPESLIASAIELPILRRFKHFVDSLEAPQPPTRDTESSRPKIVVKSDTMAHQKPLETREVSQPLGPLSNIKLQEVSEKPLQMKEKSCTRPCETPKQIVKASLRFVIVLYQPQTIRTIPYDCSLNESCPSSGRLRWFVEPRLSRKIRPV